MTTFTIHTDEKMADAIRQGAAEAGKSINKFIQDALGGALGLFKRKRSVFSSAKNARCRTSST